MQTYQIVIGLVLLVVGIISKYNGLVNMANRVKEGFSLIDVYLKQRYDLLPNLVELAKQYMAHERGLLERITELRTQLYAGNQTEDNKVNVFNELERNTHQLMVMVENYPQIKASDVFVQLHQSWEEVEENLAAARRSYNAAVTRYNTTTEQFPSNILADLFGFDQKPLLEIPDAERQNISAKNLFNP